MHVWSASSLVYNSPLAVITVVGILDFGRVSGSAELKSFSISMCIDAPESTTNSRSCDFFEVAPLPMRRSSGAERGLVPGIEHISIYRQVPCFSAGTSFLVQGFLKCSILKLWLE